MLSETRAGERENGSLRRLEQPPRGSPEKFLAKTGMSVCTRDDHAGAIFPGQRQQSGTDIAVYFGQPGFHIMTLQPAFKRARFGDRASGITFKVLGRPCNHDMAQCADQRQVKAHGARGAIAAIPRDDHRPGILELAGRGKDDRQARIHHHMFEGLVQRLTALGSRAREDDSLRQGRGIRACALDRIHLMEECTIQPVRAGARRIAERCLGRLLHRHLQVNDALRGRCGQAGGFRCRCNHQHRIRVRQGKQARDRRIQPPGQFNSGQGRLTVLRVGSLQYGNNGHGTSPSG